MNRIVVFGLALFFALVGIALVGGENKASAFIFGGGGCGGCSGMCGGGGCHHRHHGGCHARHHRCHGRCNGGCMGGGCMGGGGCCGGGGGGCCGGGYAAAPVMEKQAPAPAPMQAPAK